MHTVSVEFERHEVPDGPCGMKDNCCLCKQRYVEHCDAVDIWSKRVKTAFSTFSLIAIGMLYYLAIEK